VWTSKNIAASSDLAHRAATSAGVSAHDVDATGHDTCVTDKRLAATVTGNGATEKCE